MVTKQGPLGPSQDRLVPHTLCFSASLKYPDNSIWYTFPELFHRCENSLSDGRCYLLDDQGLIAPGLLEPQFSCWVVSSSLRPHGLQQPGFPVHHQIPELTPTHVHWIGDAIQPSHPLLSPSAPAFNLSQCQGLFQWVSSLHQVAKILEFRLQHQSFQCIFRTDFL